MSKIFCRVFKTALYVSIVTLAGKKSFAKFSFFPILKFDQKLSGLLSKHFSRVLKTATYVSILNFTGFFLWKISFFYHFRTLSKEEEIIGFLAKIFRRSCQPAFLASIEKFCPTFLCRKFFSHNIFWTLSEKVLAFCRKFFDLLSMHSTCP